MNEDNQIQTSNSYFFRNCYNTVRESLFAFCKKQTQAEEWKNFIIEERESLCTAHLEALHISKQWVGWLLMGYPM